MMPTRENAARIERARAAWREVAAWVDRAADDYERWLWRPEQRDVAHQALAELHERVRLPAQEGELAAAWYALMGLMQGVAMTSDAHAELGGAWRGLALAGRAMVGLAGGGAG